MVSIIAANRPNEHFSIRHVGVVSQGMDDTEATRSNFAPAYEIYALKEITEARDS